MEPAKRICVFAFIVGIAASGPSQAGGRLDVQIRYPADPGGHRSDAGKGEIEVVLANPGDSAIDVGNRGLPAVNGQGKLLENVFSVRSEDGQPVGYKGIYVEYAAGIEQGYLSLQPGQQRVFGVNLALSYQMKSGGIYTVSIDPGIAYLRKPRPDFAEKAESAIE